jgi:hypothetical protein
MVVCDRVGLAVFHPYPITSWYNGLAFVMQPLGEYRLLLRCFVIFPAVTVLEQTLQYVVDHGVRPTCIRDVDPRFHTALTLKDRIHPSQLDQKFIYPTHFCCTGWSYLSLTPNELSQIFGLPLLCRLSGLQPVDFEHLLPAHLLHAVLNDYYTTRSSVPSKPIQHHVQ